MKQIFFILVMLLPTQILAQEIEPLNIYDSKLYCYNPQEVFAIATAFGEKPLFTGYSTVDSATPEGNYVALSGPMMFLVNQDTGTWVAGMMSPAGELCSIAVGSDFEPYTE